MVPAPKRHANPARRVKDNANVERAQLVERAYQMRLEGYNHAEIAEELDISSSCVSNYLRTAIEARTLPLAEEVRKQELDRLELMWRWLVPRMRRGDPQAIGKGLNILERRAKYISGVEAPQQVDLMLGEGKIDSELAGLLKKVHDENAERERTLAGEGEWADGASEGSQGP